MKPIITWSIVIHNQGNLLKKLLDCFLKIDFKNYEFVITVNIQENLNFIKKYKNLDIEVIKNLKPKGFSENHNFAFTRSRGTFFAVINPDITFNNISFKQLTSVLEKDIKIGVCAPRILNPNGSTEDTSRRFPKIYDFIVRFYRKKSYKTYNKIDFVDWVAGMFMLFRKSTYRKVNGFDTRFFLYMEDVDICRKINFNNFKVAYIPYVYVTHDARRYSRKSLYYFLIHTSSILKYYYKYLFKK